MVADRGDMGKEGEAIHDNRWNVDPGNLQSRWAPCGQAHGQGQGQLP
jgi:hypothetical protein